MSSAAERLCAAYRTPFSINGSSPRCDCDAASFVADHPRVFESSFTLFSHLRFTSCRKGSVGSSRFITPLQPDGRVDDVGARLENREEHRSALSQEQGWCGR